MAVYESIGKCSDKPHTQMFWEFCDEIEIQIKIIYFLIDLAQRQDKGQLIAKLTLERFQSNLSETKSPDSDRLSDKYKNIDEIKSEALTEGPATEVFGKMVADLYRNMFVRSVESFETYLSDLLATIYLAKPEMLKSKETLTLEEVLLFENRLELVRYASEKRIMNLQMQGLRAVKKYVFEQHGLDWFDRNDEAKVSAAMAIRNLIVHNKSRVNFHYLKLYPDCGIEIGNKIKIIKFAEEKIGEIVEIGSKVDLLTAEKFNLETLSNIEYKSKKSEG